MKRIGEFIVDGGWPVAWSVVGWDMVVLVGLLAACAAWDIFTK